MFQTHFLGKIKTLFFCSITFLRKSFLLKDNVEKYGRSRQATDNSIVRHLGFTDWITEATDTHSEYVILIALPRQHWLREHTSMLRLYVYIYSLSFYLIIFRRSLTMEHFRRLDCDAVNCCPP
jgi:hypothetical protein